MPVGTKTIPPAIPDTQYKPGKGGERKRNQVNFPRYSENPAYHIKKSNCGVKYKKENIEELVPHPLKLKRFKIAGKILQQASCQCCIIAG
jgi:hypothetical protein